MPPLVLALIDSVFALALHHDKRARRGLPPDLESASVRAQVMGPETEGPARRGLVVRVSVSQVKGQPAEVTEDSVCFHVDLDEGRLLAMDLNLAELPIDRSGLARLIGELESWCYLRIPIATDPATKDAD